MQHQHQLIHKVFLAGVAFDFTEKDLYQFFGPQYSSIQSIDLIKQKKNKRLNKGCGFMELTDAAEVADLLAREHFSFNGREFLVKEYKKGGDLEESKKDFIKRRLFIQNVHKKITNKQLRNFFGGLVNLEDAYLIKTDKFVKVGQEEAEQQRKQEGRQRARVCAGNDLQYGFILVKHASDVDTLLQKGPFVIRGLEVGIERYDPERHHRIKDGLRTKKYKKDKKVKKSKKAGNNKSSGQSSQGRATEGSGRDSMRRSQCASGSHGEPSWSQLSYHYRGQQYAEGQRSCQFDASSVQRSQYMERPQSYHYQNEQRVYSQAAQRSHFGEPEGELDYQDWTQEQEILIESILNLLGRTNLLSNLSFGEASCLEQIRDMVMGRGLEYLSREDLQRSQKLLSQIGSRAAIKNALNNKRTPSGRRAYQMTGRNEQDQQDSRRMQFFKKEAGHCQVGKFERSSKPHYARSYHNDLDLPETRKEVFVNCLATGKTE